MPAIAPLNIGTVSSIHLFKAYNMNTMSKQDDGPPLPGHLLGERLISALSAVSALSALNSENSRAGKTQKPGFPQTPVVIPGLLSAHQL